jgi:predicted alpha/beta superfamily hydrolase
MQDGQNLFEAETAAFGSWKLPYRMKNLTKERQVIIVGIDNGENHRINEYAPYYREGKDITGGGEGDLYMQFIVETVKEFIDNTYRTLPFRETTGIAGSSMGGLISLYAGLKYGQYFGKVGVLSPALWFNPQVIDLVKSAEWKSDFYIAGSLQESVKMPMNLQKLYWAFKQNGFNDRQYRVVIRDRGRHNEAFWSKEFRQMMIYLFFIKY